MLKETVNPEFCMQQKCPSENTVEIKALSYKQKQCFCQQTHTKGNIKCFLFWLKENELKLNVRIVGRNGDLKRVSMWKRPNDY